MLKSFSSAQGFLSQFNYDFCRERYMAKRSLKSALVSNTIKVRELAACYDDETVQLWMEAWLVNLSQHMDFQISESQSKETAYGLVEVLYMLNLAEITLFFRKLHNGQYGRFYGKFDMQTILIAAREYREERGKILSRMSTKEQQLINK